MNDSYKGFFPYLLASIGFIVTITIVLILIDSVLFPALIHDKEKIKVPQLIGKNITEAEKLIVESELSIGQISEQFNQNIPQGTIINQVPKHGVEVKSGRSIYLSVSKGREMVKVPYIVGQNLRTARITLKNVGLETGNITYEYNDYYGIDTVFAQLVSSGRDVPFGTNVDISVSKGSDNQVMVPSLIGKRFEDVEQMLLESGLILGTIMTQQHDTFLPNTVIKQTPESGILVETGASINIVISK